VCVYAHVCVCGGLIRYNLWRFSNTRRCTYARAHVATCLRLVILAIKRYAVRFAHNGRRSSRRTYKLPACTRTRWAYDAYVSFKGTRARLCVCVSDQNENSDNTIIYIYGDFLTSSERASACALDIRPRASPADSPPSPSRSSRARATVCVYRLYYITYLLYYAYAHTRDV